MMNRAFWPLDDPAAFDGTEAETLEKFRRVRDELETRIKEWISVTT